MSWFRIDDGFHGHPKVLALFEGPCPGDALALWTLAGSWSSDQLSDGYVPVSFVRRSGLDKRAAAELVRVGLWMAVDGDGGPTGYQFHQWTDRNPTREKVLREREAARERQIRARSHRSNGETASSVQANHAVASPAVTSVSRCDKQRDSACDFGVSHTTPSRPDPVPKNSDRSRSGDLVARAPVLPLRPHHGEHDGHDLATAAMAAYAAALEAHPPACYVRRESDRPAFERAAAVAERVRPKDPRGQLTEWAQRYVSERSKRTPLWFAEACDRYAQSGDAPARIGMAPPMRPDEDAGCPDASVPLPEWPTRRRRPA